VIGLQPVSSAALIKRRKSKAEKSEAVPESSTAATALEACQQISQYAVFSVDISRHFAPQIPRAEATQLDT
jgi:hypothetical protein